MTNKEFDEILTERLISIKTTLASKAKEYATEDKLHNFKRAAYLNETTPPNALLGMLVKHWVSIMDLAAKHSVRHTLSQDMINEKIGDAINYLILLEALMKEKI